MALAEMRTLFGLRVTARWASGQVLVRVGDEAETSAFPLAVERALGLLADPSGRWWLSYADDAGEIVRWHSDDRGQTWEVLV